MKIWVVWLDGEREYASSKYTEAHERYWDLVKGYGADRVDMTKEVI